MQNPNLTKLFSFLLIWAFSPTLVVSAAPLEKPSWSAEQVEGLRIDREPNPADWQYFFKVAPEVRSKLWQYHQKRGRKWASWSWQWRIGWLQACRKDPAPHCPEILRMGLNDDALVVRAEAAMSTGIRYRGSQNAIALEQLKAARIDPRNYRHKKPLFAIEKIDLALTAIRKQTQGDTRLKSAR